MNRVRHSDVTKALKAYNDKRGLKYPDIGYVYYADVVGDGSGFKPRCYQIISAGGAVSLCYKLQGSTIRKTLTNIASEMKEVQPNANV